MNAVKMMKAAVKAGPMDELARMAYADACEEEGLDKKAKRQRRIGKAIRRGWEKNRGPGVIYHYSAWSVKRCTGFVGHRISVRPVETMTLGEGSTGHVYNTRLRIASPFRMPKGTDWEIELKPGKAIVWIELDVDLVRRLVVYCHPSDWPHFDRAEALDKAQARREAKERAKARKRQRQ